MYSTGVQNRIQVSQQTRDLLCDRYDFEYRDHIEVKGVDGGMDTYLLVGRKGHPPNHSQYIIHFCVLKKMRVED
ncbi:Adenylate cyclase type [Dirofilaria immitis]